ncbi:hypothetical protein [Paenibacillus arenosi]|uniref:Uncharacterized protein n=1 Tax=Paenibacillus arenosi TaxID=2774142 RepID=A0ABR9AYD2_9BACL|nr:hypothetical protein [Paenibacillus arenosi]MBD8498896.1 hypothetical protein [Paenibacillus arenosi]
MAARKKKEKTSAIVQPSEVVRETTHQLLSHSQLIYSIFHADAAVVVENLGFGDVYVSDAPNVEIGNEQQRLLFKEQRIFNGVAKLFFATGSEPVVSILEVK